MSSAFSELDPFHVARILGSSGIDMLSHAEKIERERSRIYAKMANETSEEVFANAGATGSKARSSEETLRRFLFPAVMLYQSSMEAKLKLAADKSEAVCTAISSLPRNQANFSGRWEKALETLGQPTTEFQEYAEILYRGIRNPLVHLYDDRENRSAGKLAKINDITFEAAYTGIRYGWWSYMRLLFGLGLADRQLKVSWCYICNGAGLSPDLYDETMPPETV